MRCVSRSRLVLVPSDDIICSATNFPRMTETFSNCPPHIILIFRLNAKVDDSPANGSFTVELATNRAFTTLSFDGTNVGVFPDGQDYTSGLGGTECITELNSAVFFTYLDAMPAKSYHAQYTLRIKAWPPGQRSRSLIRYEAAYVIPEQKLNFNSFPRIHNSTSLSVQPARRDPRKPCGLHRAIQVRNLFLILRVSGCQFTYPRNSTPWERLATYQVPDLPACPSGGCICAVRPICYLLLPPAGHSS